MAPKQLCAKRVPEAIRRRMGEPGLILVTTQDTRKDRRNLTSHEPHLETRYKSLRTRTSTQGVNIEHKDFHSIFKSNKGGKR